MSETFMHLLGKTAGRFAILSLACLSLFSCGGEVAEAETEHIETEPARIYTAEDLEEIVMTLDKEEVTAGVGDIIEITAVGYADDGTEIPDLEFEYYCSGDLLPGRYYAPIDTGFYNLYVRYGDVMSNVIEVESHDPLPVSIDFNYRDFKILTGESVNFNINAYSEFGRTKSKNVEVTINGETKHFTVYKMETAGVYEAYVSVGDVKSPTRVFSVVNREKYDLKLAASTKNAKPGDTISFTVTADSKMTGKPITSGTPDLKLCGVGVIDGLEYTVTEPGFYSFYLDYNGETSDTVVITVSGDAETTQENGFEGYATDLPAIVIDTNGRGINGVKKIDCTVSVYGNKGGGVEKGQLPDIVTLGEIKYRGQSSAGFEKKQYSLHTKNEDGSNNNIKLLGLPKENDWVLNGSYADKSLIRNGLVQTMLADVMDYTPRTKYCEVYLKRDNGTLDYVGVYTLVESIKIDKDRVDIEKLTKEDNHRPEITGGYIVSIDKLKGDENTVDTELGTWTIVKPSADEITQAQDTYISQFLKDFSKTLRSDKRSNEKNGLRSYIDESTVAAPLLITELVKNIDGFAISTYFYMDREGLLKYGPGWDYDLTFGNADYNDGVNPEGWYVLSYTSFARNMSRDDDFAQLLIDTWRELRKGMLSDESLEKYIDDQVALVGDAAIARSSARWPNHWNGNYVWPNHNYGEYFTKNHAEEIEKMRKFVLARAEWMDKHIEELMTLN